MLIPRFTIRWLMLLTAVCGVFSFVISRAIVQEAWAIGVSVAVFSLIFLFVIYSLCFLIGWMFSSMLRQFQQNKSIRSPFAADRTPTQLIEPRNPDS